MHKIKLLALLLWLAVLSLVLFSGSKRAEHEIAHVLKGNATQLQQLLSVALAYNRAIASQMISSLEHQHRDHWHPELLQDYPEHGVYALADSAITDVARPVANLSGIGRLDGLSIAQQAEISAALSLNLTAPLNDQEHFFIWSYYTSDSGFMLLAPYVAVESFHMAPEVYQKPFWQVAEPASNPDRLSRISGLYEDGAGQGMMISISTPVFADEVFKGIVSLDVGLAYLQAVLHGDELDLGVKPVIVDERGELVVATQMEQAKVSSTSFMQLLDSPSYQMVQSAEAVHMQSELIHDKFRVGFNLSNLDFRRLVLKQSMLECILVSMLMLVVFLLLKLRSALSRATNLAEHDGLTHLFNRITFEELAAKLMSTQMKRRQAFSILMIDIDHFKRVNDQYGHHIGDLGIQHVANIIAANARKTDLVARFGGEEFVLALPNTDIQQAQALAERIRIMMMLSVFDNDKSVTVSIGIAESHALAIDTLDGLCQCADAALYQAKRSGRNCSIVYDPTLTTASKRH